MGDEDLQTIEQLLNDYVIKVSGTYPFAPEGIGSLSDELEIDEVFETQSNATVRLLTYAEYLANDHKLPHLMMIQGVESGELSLVMDYDKNNTLVDNAIKNLSKKEKYNFYSYLYVTDKEGDKLASYADNIHYYVSYAKLSAHRKRDELKHVVTSSYTYSGCERLNSEGALNHIDEYLNYLKESSY